MSKDKGNPNKGRDFRKSNDFKMPENKSYTDINQKKTYTDIHDRDHYHDINKDRKATFDESNEKLSNQSRFSASDEYKKTQEQRQQDYVRRQEQQRRQDEQLKQDEQRKQEEIRKQEEEQRQTEIRRQEEIKRQEDIRRQEEIRRQEDTRRQDEYRQIEERRRQDELLKREQEIRQQYAEQSDLTQPEYNKFTNQNLQDVRTSHNQHRDYNKDAEHLNEAERLNRMSEAKVTGFKPTDDFSQRTTNLTDANDTSYNKTFDNARDTADSGFNLAENRTSHQPTDTYKDINEKKTYTDIQSGGEYKNIEPDRKVEFDQHRTTDYGSQSSYDPQRSQHKRYTREAYESSRDTTDTGHNLKQDRTPEQPSDTYTDIHRKREYTGIHDSGEYKSIQADRKVQYDHPQPTETPSSAYSPQKAQQKRYSREAFDNTRDTADSGFNLADDKTSNKTGETYKDIHEQKTYTDIHGGREYKSTQTERNVKYERPQVQDYSRHIQYDPKKSQQKRYTREAYESSRDTTDTGHNLKQDRTPEQPSDTYTDIHRKREYTGIHDSGEYKSIQADRKVQYDRPQPTETPSSAYSPQKAQQKRYSREAFDSARDTKDTGHNLISDKEHDKSSSTPYKDIHQKRNYTDIQDSGEYKSIKAERKVQYERVDRLKTEKSENAKQKSTQQRRYHQGIETPRETAGTDINRFAGKSEHIGYIAPLNPKKMDFSAKEFKDIYEKKEYTNIHDRSKYTKIHPDTKVNFKDDRSRLDKTRDSSKIDARTKQSQRKPKKDTTNFSFKEGNERERLKSRRSEGFEEKGTKQTRTGSKLDPERVKRSKLSFTDEAESRLEEGAVGGDGIQIGKAHYGSILNRYQSGKAIDKLMKAPGFLIGGGKKAGEVIYSGGERGYKLGKSITERLTNKEAYKRRIEALSRNRKLKRNAKIKHTKETKELVNALDKEKIKTDLIYGTKSALDRSTANILLSGDSAGEALEMQRQVVIHLIHTTQGIRRFVTKADKSVKRILRNEKVKETVESINLAKAKSVKRESRLKFKDFELDQDALQVKNKVRSVLSHDRASYQSRKRIFVGKNKKAIQKVQIKKKNAQKVRDTHKKAIASHHTKDKKRGLFGFFKKKKPDPVKEGIKAKISAVVMPYIAPAIPIILAVLGGIILIFLLMLILSGVMMGTSYMADDNEISMAIKEFSRMEANLSEYIDNLEERKPGYDSYRPQPARMGFDPQELIAYLTAKYGDFQVKDIDMVAIFNEVYEQKEYVDVERRYTNAEGEVVMYYYYILNSTVKNRTISYLVDQLEKEEKEHYDELMETKGNFANCPSPIAVEGVKDESTPVLTPGTGGGGSSHNIPGTYGWKKTYMDYRTITRAGSKQLELQQSAVDGEFGIRHYNGLPMVAVAELYATVGDEIEVTFSNGNTIRAVVGDIKARQHVDDMGVHLWDGSMVEFIVNDSLIPSAVLNSGSFGVLPEFEGYVVRIVSNGKTSSFSALRVEGDWKLNGKERYGYYYDREEGVKFRDYITIKTAQGEDIYAPFDKGIITVGDELVSIMASDKFQVVFENVKLTVDIDYETKAGRKIAEALGTEMKIYVLDPDGNYLDPYLYFETETKSAGTIWDPSGMQNSRYMFAGDIMIRDDVVFYSQHDPRWAGHPYSCGGISGYGCGPTSVAMVVSTLTGRPVYPPEIADFSTRNGHVYGCDGSAWSLFPSAGRAYGLRVVQLSSAKSMSEYAEHFSQGAVIILSGYTRGGGGHIMVATGIEGGQLKLNDPNDIPRTHLETYGYGFNSLRAAWAFYPN